MRVGTPGKAKANRKYETEDLGKQQKLLCPVT
jgi:hypothetical protein